MNMIQALNSAHGYALARDPSVVILGEDVGYFGGVFRVHRRLQKKHGEHRVFDTPDRRRRHRRRRTRHGGEWPEARRGDPVRRLRVSRLRPDRERSRAHAVSQRRRIHRAAGVRMPCGGGIRGGQTHSQSPEALFAHVCGVKVVMPSNPYDAKGLLLAAIEDPDPVIFLEPKRLYNGPFDGDPNKPATSWAGASEERSARRHYTVPLGSAEVVRAGSAVTVIAYGTLVHVAVGDGREDGHRCGSDRPALHLAARYRHPVASVKKTGRCVIAHEATRFCGFGAELAATIQEQCFWHLEAPDPARCRLGYTLSAGLRVGVFSRTGPFCRGARGRHGVAMSRQVFKLPDLGEGTVSAEIVAWRVGVGDSVKEDEPLVEVSTEKAVVEVPAPVTGRVLTLHGQPGDTVAVGGDLVSFETEGAANGGGKPAAARRLQRRRRQSAPAEESSKAPRQAAATSKANRVDGAQSSRVMASPATRRRAHEAGIDLCAGSRQRTGRAHRAQRSRVGAEGAGQPRPRRVRAAKASKRSR